MTRKRTTVPGALALLLVAATAVADERPAFVPANDDIRAIEIASEPASYEVPSSDGPIELKVAAACSRQRPTHSDITLGWDTHGVPAELRLDITGFSDGFATGRYVTSGPRAGARRSLTFLDGEAGVYYYWRLLSPSAEGWTVRANGRFEAPSCPHDSTGEPES